MIMASLAFPAQVPIDAKGEAQDALVPEDKVLDTLAKGVWRPLPPPPPAPPPSPVPNPPGTVPSSWSTALPPGDSSAWGSTTAGMVNPVDTPSCADGRGCKAYCKNFSRFA